MKIIYSAILFFILSLSSYRLLAQATITSFSPVAGATGSTVTITGTNFNSIPSGNIVFFGATKATVVTGTTTSLSVTVPAGATYQPLSVTNAHLTGYSTMPFGFLTTFTSKNSIALSDFSAAQNFTTGTAPSRIAIGDMDGDGKADIISANYISETVSIFRNTSTSGTISFAAKADINTNSEPLALAVADLNADGKPEIIVGNSYTTGGAGVGSTITVFRNNSIPGTFSFSSSSFTTGNEPYDIAAGDINGDGKIDLVVADYNNGGTGSPNVSILRDANVGSVIIFAPQITLTSTNVAGGISLGDLDGDGKPDIAVSNSGIFGSYGTSVSVFRNTTTTGSATLTFAAKQDFATGSSPYPVNVADIDGDGKNDLVTANFASNNMSVLRSTSTSGTISFASAVNFTTGDGPSYLGIGDLDGDGKPDVAVANFGSSSTGNTVSVFRNTSTSGSVSFATKVDFSTGTAPYAAMIGDLDNDGKADMAVSNYGSTSNGVTLSVLRNNPAAILPLKLISFTGKLINNNRQVQLNWQTAEEQDVSVFEAEWSSDSGSWQKIAGITAKNNGANTYSCIHSTLSSVNFYRLKMIDIDGKFTYSPIVSIAMPGEFSPALYPNPATNNITVTGLGNKPVSISLVSSKGELIMQKKVFTTSATLDISNLSRGIYLMQIIQNGKRSTYKFNKE